MRRFRLRRRRLVIGFPAVATTTAAVVLALTGIAAPAAGKTRGHRTHLAADRTKVHAGAKVELSGRFAAEQQPSAAPAPGTQVPKPPARVKVQFKAAGKDHYHQVAITKTNRKGSYKAHVRVKRSGHYRVLAGDGRSSVPQWVRVKSRLRSRLAHKDVDLGDKLKVKGRVSPAIGRRVVVVKAAHARATTKTNRHGHFKVKLKAKHPGTHKVTVKARGDRVAAGSKDRAGTATVYRPAEASWYGPGLYGGALACGGTLQPGTMGVANKELPCGTHLKLHYRHKTVKVKVIDRGPYAGNREFDLTEATKNKLGFPDVGTVWASK